MIHVIYALERPLRGRVEEPLPSNGQLVERILRRATRLDGKDRDKLGV